MEKNFPRFLGKNLAVLVLWDIWITCSGIAQMCGGLQVGNSQPFARGVTIPPVSSDCADFAVDAPVLRPKCIACERGNDYVLLPTSAQKGSTGR